MGRKMGDRPSPRLEARLLDAALESIPYGFCVWNERFRLVRWNKRYLDMYGFPAERVHRGIRLEVSTSEQNRASGAE